MRIIGGIYKGRKLLEFKGQEVRPTSDMARESLFNILQNEVPNCNFLDAFAGTGAVGIESLSRGAKSVTFVDFAKESVNLVKQNLAKLGVENAQVILGDGVSFMQNSSPAYDIIFLDPPYKLDIKEKALTASLTALKDNGIVVLEDEKPFLGEIKGLTRYDERKYGRAHFTFFYKGE